MATTGTVERTRTAFSYIRFSTPDQLLGDSERRQLANARAWAAELGFELDDRCRDEGYSAFRGRHRKKGSLRILLEMAERGEISDGTPLFIEEINRLTREPPFDAVTMIWKLIEAGFALYVLRGRKIYSRETINRGAQIDQLIGQIQRAFDESAEKSERVRERLNQRKKAAHDHHTPYSPVCPAFFRAVTPDGASQPTHYEPIPGRADIVRRIFDLRETAHSIRDIYQLLNAEQVPTFSRSGQGLRDKRQAENWESTQIWRILRSRAVIGEGQLYTRVERTRAPNGEPFLDDEGKPESRLVSIPHGPPIPNYYGPGIIAREQFDRVQAILDNERRTGGPRGTQFRNLLRSLCLCAICDSPMMSRFEVKKGTEHQYFYCNRRRRGGGCWQPYQDYAKAEAGALAALRDELFPHGTFIRGHSEIDRLTREIEAAQDRIKALQAQNEILLDSSSRSVIQRIEQNDAKITSEEAALQRLDAQRTRLRLQQPQAHAEIVASILDDARGGDLRARTRVYESLRAVIARIDCFPGERQVIHRRDGVIAYVRHGQIVAGRLTIVGGPVDLDWLEDKIPDDARGGVTVVAPAGAGAEIAASGDERIPHPGHHDD